MRKNGWYGDNWRHSLAAKGIRSASKNRFFATKTSFADAAGTTRTPGSDNNDNDGSTSEEKSPETTKKSRVTNPFVPGTILQRERDRIALENLQDKRVRELSRGNQILENVSGGNFADIIRAGSVDQIEGLNDPEKRAIRAELQKQAVAIAQSGEDVPENIKRLLPSTTRSQLKQIKAEQLKENRGSIAQTFATAGESTLEGAERGFANISGEIFSESTLKAEPEGPTTGDKRIQLALEGRKFQRAANIRESTSSGFPFVDISDNVFLGDGDNTIGRDQDNGKLNFLDDANSPSIELSSAIVPKERFRGVDFGGVADPSRKTLSDRIATEVEQLWTQKKELGKTNLNPFKKGEKAFKNGDREKLIEAMNEQEFEVKQQESRWKMVEQTRQRLESQQNVSDIHAKAGKDSFSFSILSEGDAGKKIADQTDKINEVKRSIKQGADEARVRAAKLRGALARMDSTVPPEISVPSKEVNVLKKEFSFRDIFAKRGLLDESQ